MKINTYTSILKEAQIEKGTLSNVSGFVYDAFLNQENEQDINFVEMELLLSFLEQERKIVKYLLYNDKLTTPKQEADAIDFLSKVDFLRESFDILQGKVKIEDLEAAAKTLIPKMQSSFGE